MVGFTQFSGNDLIYDLGAEASLTNGKTWNLQTLLTGFTLNTVNWGVVGDNKTAQTPQHAVYTTVQNPITINGTSAWAPIDTATKSIYQNFSSAGAGQSLLISFADQNSWDSQMESPTLTSQYGNLMAGNPDVTGLTNVSLFQILNDGSTPTIIGRFSLGSNGVLTYNTNSVVIAAPTANFTGTPTAGTVPLNVVFSDASSGNITNWLWNFGDGHTVTNTSSASVTNTYTMAASYSVSLTVTGPGGTNAITKTSYIVVSAASSNPRFNSLILSGGQLILSGTNGTASTQYRIFTTTNLALPFASWTPVYTNNFLANGSFAYTNSTAKPAAFFRFVTP